MRCSMSCNRNRCISLLSKFSVKVLHLPKNMALTYVTRSLTYLMTASSPPHHQIPMESSERLDHSALRDEHFTNCGTKHNSGLNKVLQVIHKTSHSLAQAVNYKPSTDRESQIDGHVRQKQDTTAQLKKNWSDEVASFARYYADKQPFIDMLSQFQCMWIGHLGPITVAKHHVELLRSDTAAVHPAAYRAGPTTREV